MASTRPGDRSAISVSGLDALRATLRVMGRGSNREALRILKAAAQPVADDARRRAERQQYKTPPQKRTGAYAKGFRPSVTGSRVQVVNRWPGANVNHWGGTIRPRGVAIKFERRPVLAEAAAHKGPEVERALTDGLNALAEHVR